MTLIGIDPHKASHTAVAIDCDERPLGELRADRRQCERLLAWADPFDARTWAIESAGGLGYLLAQQLVAAGEHVVDVPATLSARVRVLGSGRSSKNDPNDALSAAIAALRHPSLRIVTTEDHATVLRMLAIRHHDLTGLRTQAICRLHALLAAMVPGGAGRRRLTAAQAIKVLRRVRPLGAVEVERMDHARALLHGVRRLEHELVAVKDRIATAVAAAGTSVTDVPGVGPIIACLLIGHSSDITRFASRDHYASYTGTAPIEASSGPRVRHRLNPRGNRQLNHALHMAAVTQVRHAGPGRVYYDRKLAEGKSRKEALRALKRRIADAVYRHLIEDAHRRRCTNGPGRTPRGGSSIQRGRLRTLTPALRISHSRTQPTTLRP